MAEVVSIKFKSRGKAYFFDPAGLELLGGTTVVVETAKGLELGECAIGNHEVDDEKVVPPLRPVVRIATDDDLRVAENNKSKEKDAFEICKKKISEHNLDMKLVDVEYNFEGNKILFFFTSDGRVDFRELVKDLASVFRMRIELRQIGVRDEAKMLGGIGICGRPFCCNRFLDEFQPVSTKMAKTQSMSLNPAKISGNCGRLMCCLRYEQEAYENLVKTVPKNGTFVETAAGYGNVVQVNLLRQRVKVKLDVASADQQFKQYDVDEIAVVPGGRPKPGEPMPPSTLVIKPKEKEEPPKPLSYKWEPPETAKSEPKKSANSRKRSRPAQGKGGQPPRTEAAEASEPRAPRTRQKPKQTPHKKVEQKPLHEAQQKAQREADSEIKKKARPRRRYGRKPKSGSDSAPSGD